MPIDRNHLLTTRQMAEFVADGFLIFPEVVPTELNDAFLDEWVAGLYSRGFGVPDHTKPITERGGQPLEGFLADSKGIGQILRLDAIEGIIASLAGPGPLYDHHYVHIAAAGTSVGQRWHADNMIDPRVFTFDVQLFYFPHDTPKEMGGTLILPGSHFRRT
jgi:hypothetical protein